MTDPPRGEAIYDVFISYSHRDRSWVMDQLLPRLRQAGLRVCIDDDFRAGRSARDNMTEAIRCSRRTLLVVTSAWLESSHSRYEHQIAGMLDPDGRDARVIPLRLEKVELPLELSNLSYRDYLRPSGEAWRNLLIDLAADVRRAPEPPRALTRTGLSALTELLRTDETVRTVIAGYEIDLDRTRREISVINELKLLHDGLQATEPSLRVLEILRPRPPAEEGAWEELDLHLPMLRGALGTLLDLAGRDSMAESERPWTDELAALLRGLEHAAAGRERVTVGRLLERMRLILDRQLSRTDARLADRARSLELNGQVEALRKVAENLADAGLEADARDRFREGLEAITEIESRFRDRVRRHNSWQQLYDQLRSVDWSVSQGSLDLLELQWPDLAKATQALCLDDSSEAEPLRRSLEAMESALAAPTAPRRLQSTFRSFETEARRVFNREDRALLDICDSLSRLGDPLRELGR